MAENGRIALAVLGQNMNREDKKKVEDLLNMMGICEEVNEKYMDAITALTGSGPGYLSIIIEALQLPYCPVD